MRYQLCSTAVRAEIRQTEGLLPRSSRSDGAERYIREVNVEVSKRNNLLVSHKDCALHSFYERNQSGRFGYLRGFVYQCNLEISVTQDSKSST